MRSASADERSVLVERARELKAVVADAETEARELDALLQDILLGIPNLPADDIPDGSSEDDARRPSTSPRWTTSTSARSSASSTSPARRSWPARASSCCAAAAPSSSGR